MHNLVFGMTDESDQLHYVNAAVESDGQYPVLTENHLKTICRNVFDQRIGPFNPHWCEHWSQVALGGETIEEKEE